MSWLVLFTYICVFGGKNWSINKSSFELRCFLFFFVTKNLKKENWFFEIIKIQFKIKELFSCISINFITNFFLEYANLISNWSLKFWAIFERKFVLGKHAIFYWYLYTYFQFMILNHILIYDKIMIYLHTLCHNNY